MLPHLNNRDMGSTQPSKYKRIWGPLSLFFRKLRGRSPDAREQMRTTPPSKPNFYDVRLPSVSSGDHSANPATSCASGCVAVSGERISRGPPGNVVALGCLPPLRRVQSGQLRHFLSVRQFRTSFRTPIFHSSKEWWGVASHFRYSSSEQFRNAAQV